MNGLASLTTVPQEVLEHIAFYAGTDTLLGPPSSLLPLLSCNRTVHDGLSFSSNPYLYARIFHHKFDVSAPLARLGSDRLSSKALAHELRRRCLVLKRLRSRMDSKTRGAQRQEAGDDGITLQDLLLTSYIMLLENEGKNKQQLLDFGGMKGWIKEFWFDQHGASYAIYNIRIGRWPARGTETALAMWIYWFLLKGDEYRRSIHEGVESPINIIKAMALGAHLYDLTNVPWTDFEPSLRDERPSADVVLYGESIQIVPPPLATPAILSFLTLVNSARSIPLTPSDAPLPDQPYREWDSEWARCFVKPKRDITECFRPGSIEGIWEGFFTYTEFTAYAGMLAGAAPTIIQKGVVGRHQQTWKLREYHLLAPDHSDSDSGIDLDVDAVHPLPPGDPLRSYFPIGTQIREHFDGLMVENPRTREVRSYKHGSLPINASSEEQQRVKDIIITGEGHSAWGQFNLVGRVRPCDGFISLSKDYVDGDRGKWLYRGYLVGNANGNFAGRWRDTLSPADVAGYEGCFAMSRRR
ncbi:hypothetical protein CPC08DRAFT_820884 [Agrocybe pediades]|nr:hypothetical protein CPC08DRAFT_820884 [Agrocybe pediades]